MRIEFQSSWVFGPRLSSSKFNTSERLTKTLPAITVVLSRPRFMRSLMEARETSRNRAASAWEIKSDVESIFCFFGI